jgi:hypothetical protein
MNNDFKCPEILLIKHNSKVSIKGDTRYAAVENQWKKRMFSACLNFP